MLIKELEKKIIADKIPLDLYSLNGGLPNEKFCIEKIEEKWQTYYSERGLKSKIKIFNSEEDACKYFYELLSKTFK